MYVGGVMYVGRRDVRRRCDVCGRHMIYIGGMM